MCRVRNGVVKGWRFLPESQRSRGSMVGVLPLFFCIPFFSSPFFVIIGTVCGFTTEYLYDLMIY